jgi:DNA polymerase III delta prime subunit
MKYAECVADIINSFKSGPLEESELKDFYCDSTMESRTGDEHDSPLSDIFDECKTPSSFNSFLLLGHRGCGKSTELNEMSAKLKKEGYHVYTIECYRDLDVFSLTHSDLLILTGEALIRIADEISCPVDEKIINQLTGFWNSNTEVATTETRAEDLSIEAGIEAKTPVFTPLLSLFARLRADLRYNVETREIHRETIKNRSSNWLLMLNLLADRITEQLQGKQPIVIFEDLDKIDADTVWRIFSNFSATLAGIKFPAIYTFPIALSYDVRFTALEGYFKIKTLPIIKQENMDGSPYKEGFDTILEIVRKRAKLELFEQEALDNMIMKTGGSLRDLFSVIREAAQRTIRREADIITQADANRALENKKTAIVRLIDINRHYKILSEIYKGKRQLFESKEMLLEMLQANVVLAYNGKGWYNLHPLVFEFLKEQEEQGEIKF